MLKVNPHFFLSITEPDMLYGTWRQCSYSQIAVTGTMDPHFQSAHPFFQAVRWLFSLPGQAELQEHQPRMVPMCHHCPLCLGTARAASWMLIMLKREGSGNSLFPCQSWTCSFNEQDLRTCWHLSKKKPAPFKGGIPLEMVRNSARRNELL